MGSFIEEVISPIPSFAVLIPGGAAAATQLIPVWYISVLAIFAATGRTLGAMILYWLADKFEDVIFAKGRSLWGVTHEDIEKFGKKLRGHRDWTVLFSLNAIPVVPVALLSFTCGFIKLPFQTFVTATFFGTIMNAIFYLSLGYGGYKTVATFDDYGLLAEVIAAIIIVSVVGWLIYRRSARNKGKSRSGRE